MVEARFGGDKPLETITELGFWTRGIRGLNECLKNVSSMHAVYIYIYTEWAGIRSTSRV